MNQPSFNGTGVALITPFKNQAIDFDALESIIEHTLKGGVNYLVSLGTTGEAITLSSQECREVLTFTKDIVKGRVPLVAGLFGSNWTALLKQRVQSYSLEGYDAIMSSSPAYNKPPQEGIYQHYKAIAKAAKLPIILYNVPGRTGVVMSAATTLRLAALDNIIGVKEASANFDIFNEIAANKPEGFQLISGDDPITLPMIALGASGVISVIGNALPLQTSNMVRTCLEQNFKKAQPMHSMLLEFTRLCFVEGNPAGVKSGLKHLGICEDHLRLPLVPVSDDTKTKIKAQIDLILANS